MSKASRPHTATAAPVTSRLARWLPLGLAAGLAANPRVRCALRRLINRVVPTGRHVSVRGAGGVARGATLELNLREEKALWAGLYEPVVGRVFADLVAPGATVYDVGAHIGFFSIVAAWRAGPAGRVVAFEPDEENARRLRRHVELNGLTHVRVAPYAVAETAGTARLLRGLGSAMSRLAGEDDGGEAGAAIRPVVGLTPPTERLPVLCSTELRLLEAELLLFGTRGVDPGDLPARIGEAAAAVRREEWQHAWTLIQEGRSSAFTRLAVLHEVSEVDTVSLDEFVYSLGNPVPDVIKIDVEGAEERVIRGASRLLAEAAPTILCEMHKIGSARQIHKLLVARGYDLYDVEAGMAHVTDEMLAIQPGGTHILARPPAHAARTSGQSGGATP
jgi:hypothetical protein